MILKHMKRFITLSLLAVTAVAGYACAWVDTYNYYLFSPYDPLEFRSHVEQVTNDNWQAYLGTKHEYYYFDADEAIKIARKKNDALMVSYIQNLEKYLACAAEKRQEQWDYPTKEQLAARRQTLLNIRAYAQTKLNSRLRSQHALLVMRCNMLLGQHAQNVTFWVTTGAKMINSVYRDMMLNIYAGALYKTGSEYAAAQTFAAQGDWESLMTMYYKKRSCAAIREEYQRYPDSAVLPFLLKDFVNNVQEAVDAELSGEGFPQGKLFVRDIQRQEARQMISLATEVVNGRKSPVPAMWQSAKAWLEFLLGDRQTAVQDIQKALTMEGTPRIVDNARVLQLYMQASLAPADAALDNRLATELEWLDAKARDDHFFSNARSRLAHQVLIDKYAGRPVTALALMKALDCYDYDIYADTMSVERLQQYITYATTPAAAPTAPTPAAATSAPTPAVSTAGTSALDRYLKPRQHANLNALNDLVGTKYMRLCLWDEALKWLAKVPLSYYNEKGYVVYAANRKWTVEPWIQRQWLPTYITDGERPRKLTANPKATFAKEMLSLESTLSSLLAPRSTALYQRYYDLAVRYAQASFTGDCWFLMRDSKSVGDSVRLNETDLAAKALALLDKASQTSDGALRERALFAHSYGELHPSRWYRSEWNDKTYDYERVTDRGSSQYKAFAALAAYEQKQSAPAAYVSRCDEYIQFRKVYR